MMPPGENWLLLFTRFPEPGRAKTRLIPALGALGAAMVQRAMTEFVLSRVTPRRAAGVRIEVRFTGGTARQMRQWLRGGVTFAEQGAGDLGARMERAAADAFRRGARRVAIIGADCPGVDSDIVARAFERLETHDVVFSPARDGGYCLLGLSVNAPELFTGIAWGTDAVLAQSAAAAARAGRRVVKLDPLGDVDEPADLPVWEDARERASRVSVIVPALNDAAELGRTLEVLRPSRPHELIVADGGSTDGTVAVARSHGAVLVEALRGRARQMNAGAAVATGDILLFLHADTHPPEDFPALISTGLWRPGVVGGAFGFALREPYRGRALVEWGTNFRSRVFQRPYGDQGLFLSRAMFEALGGFPEWPLLEDVELTRRLRRVGRVITLDALAVTSSRQWQKLGWLRVLARNQFILLAHACGVSPERLERIYRS